MKRPPGPVISSTRSSPNRRPEAGGDSQLSREGVLHGLGHLLRLIFWYVQPDRVPNRDDFAEAIVVSAAKQARSHMGWELRDHVEQAVAAAVHRITTDFKRVERMRGDKEERMRMWRERSARLLETALRELQPTPAEIQKILNRFLAPRSSADGVVEPFFAAVRFVFGGRSINPMLELRKDVVQKGFRYRPKVRTPAQEFAALGELAAQWGDEGRLDAQLLRAILLVQKRPALAPDAASARVSVLEAEFDEQIQLPHQSTPLASTDAARSVEKTATGVRTLKVPKTGPRKRQRPR
jgi:hypothetical protein